MINRKKIRFYALLGLSIFLAYKVINIDRPFSSISYYQSDRRSELLNNTLKFNNRNPDVYFELANRSDLLLLSDESEINRLFLNTIKYNPLHVFSLIRLADINYEAGNKDLSLELVKRARKFSNFSADRLWELSFISYKLDQINMFYDCLKTVTRIDDNRREHVYVLALKLIENKEDIIKKIISEKAYIHYFRYMFTRLYDLENSRVIYNFFKENNIEIDQDTKFQYLDFLISKGSSNDAEEVWSSMYGTSDELVWNGGFEDEILNKGLDWKINDDYDYNSETKTEFETENPLRGKKSLKIRFLNKNVDYKNISQIVLVKPQTSYIFSSLVSTKNITTTNGIGWEIKCFPKGDLYLQTDYLTGTNSEKILFSKFVTPKECTSLEINLRRVKSEKFDKFISGEVEIDDVYMHEV
ncbi:MAG: tetratricopeptide repeat protein, partial [Thermodesulfobacteriota bacterium]